MSGGRKCTICGHQNRSEIDRLIISGVSLRHIAARFSVKESSLCRHKNTHLPEYLTQAAEAVEVADAQSLLSELQYIKFRAYKIIDQAEKENKQRVALSGIKDITRLLEVTARITGTIQEQQQINIMENPKFIQIQAILLETLNDFPEIKIEVAKKISELGESI